MSSMQDTHIAQLLFSWWYHNFTAFLSSTRPGQQQEEGQSCNRHQQEKLDILTASGATYLFTKNAEVLSQNHITSTSPREQRSSPQSLPHFAPQISLHTTSSTEKFLQSTCHPGHFFPPKLQHEASPVLHTSQHPLGKRDGSHTTKKPTNNEQ